jgi:hypothetical protein
VTALIRTLSEVARQYDIGTEHFLYAALRSYLALTKNAYPDIDVEAERFREKLARARKATGLYQTRRKWLSATGSTLSTKSRSPDTRRSWNFDRFS